MSRKAISAALQRAGNFRPVVYDCPTAQSWIESGSWTPESVIAASTRAHDTIRVKRSPRQFFMYAQEGRSDLLLDATEGPELVDMSPESFFEACERQASGGAPSSRPPSASRPARRLAGGIQCDRVVVL